MPQMLSILDPSTCEERNVEEESDTRPCLTEVNGEKAKV
jgi:hypothetical protein